MNFQVRHETREEGRRMLRPERCDYNNEDEVNDQNPLREKNYQASSQKFRQKIRCESQARYNLDCISVCTAEFIV